MRYTVSALAARTHLLDVELALQDVGPDPLQICFPAWVPGHYMIEDFAGVVRGESVVGDGGKPLSWRKVDKATYEIRPGRSRSVKFKFQSWAYDKSVHRSYLDDERFTLNGGHVFPYVVGRERQPSTVVFRLPDHWDGPYTGLEPVAGEPRTFTAADYDELLDCPAIAGHPHVSQFAIDGVPHYLVIAGRGNAPLGLLTQDVEKLSREAAGIFGKLPYKHYHYLVDLSTSRGGGLEHRNSTHCMLGRWGFHPRTSYVDALALFSHEFFHTWNVKRLRPYPLGPFDYSSEVRTPLLWFAEGVTSYYEMIVLRRAGCITPREFLDLIGREVQRLSLTPGRCFQTLESSSEETWIKFYKKGPHSPNSQISYYNKGCITGMLLDLEIRNRTKNKKSLDDLMRRMYEKYWRKLDRGFLPGELEEEASSLAGSDLGEFFERALRSTRELEIQGGLAHAGLEVATLDKEPPTGEVIPAVKPEPLSYLGIGLSLGKSLVVENVIEGGPAAEAGLTPGDEILAVDRMRLVPGRIESLLAETPPGKKHTFMVDRSGELREFDVVLGRRPGVSISIRPRKTAGALQKSVCKSWMKTDWSKVDRTSPPVVQRERDRVG